jgi:protein-disulfide isomerase
MQRVRHLALVALATLLLGACSSTVEPPATSTPTQEPPAPSPATATDRPTATSAPTETPSVPPPTATEPPQRATATQAPPTPTAAPSFLDVRPDDWVRGPSDAPVTIIEYSDYQ